MQASAPGTEPNPNDLEHLKLLAIFHYIVGGLVILAGSLGIFHIVMGSVMLLNPDALAGNDQQSPPALLGVIFLVLGSVLVLFGWTFGGLTIYSGRCLRAHKHWTLSVVVAAILCASVPVGTILGVFTIVVLQRPSVKRLYG